MPVSAADARDQSSRDPHSLQSAARSCTVRLGREYKYIERKREGLQEEIHLKRRSLCRAEDATVVAAATAATFLLGDDDTE